jgi:hypothetical protein
LSSWVSLVAAVEEEIDLDAEDDGQLVGGDDLACFLRAPADAVPTLAGAAAVLVDTVLEVQGCLKLAVGGEHVVAVVVDAIDQHAQRLVVHCMHNHQAQAALDGTRQPVLVNRLMCDAVPTRPAVELWVPPTRRPK